MIEELHAFFERGLALPLFARLFQLRAFFLDDLVLEGFDFKLASAQVAFEFRGLRPKSVRAFLDARRLVP